jgi:4-amino-4-deoxy-L-arabinose transferase-like glycosyltransferase
LSNWNKKNVIIVIVISLVFVILTSLAVAGYAHGDPPTTDDDIYVTIAYNIQKYKTFSLERNDTPDPEPTAYVAPGFPTWLAISIAANPNISKMDYEELYENGLKQLRLLQVPIIILIGFLSMYIVIRITGNKILGYIILFLIGSSEILEVTSNHLLSENLASLLLIIVSISLYHIYKNKWFVYYIILGISLSFLVLTKPIFMYFIVVPLIVIIVLAKRNRIKRKKIISGMFIFLIIYSLITGGWCYRNYRHFGDFSLTNGGGAVLLTRAGKNSMNVKEYFASFIYWLPGKSVRESLLNKIMDVKDYERLDRSKEISFHKTVQRTNKELIDSKIQEGYDESEAVLLTDRELRRTAINYILRNPLKHIITTLPLAWRGIFIETGFRYEILNRNLFLIQADSVLFINIILFFSLFFSIIYLIRKRKWDVFLILVPSIYLYFINSFITHNKPRYNIPILPILIFCVFIFIIFICDKYKKRKTGFF